ncbi:hypothetical protein Tco_0323611 [Tanacetum coccineum]
MSTSSSNSHNQSRIRSFPTHCKCSLPLARRISWTEMNPGRSSFYWIDGGLNSEWYKTNMYELYMAMNPEQRGDFETAINRFEMQIERQERLVSLEQEFANYKSKMEADLKKYQYGMVKWKKLGNSMVAIIVVLLGL